MKISSKQVTDKWTEFTLVNDKQMSVSLLNYGGIITEIMVPDRDGNRENVVLGFKNITDYQANPAFFGALIGPVAGRIEKASFQLDGKTYPLEKNDGENHLHSGSNGFHQVLWDAVPFQTNEAVGVKLRHQTDPKNGFPGHVDVTVTYCLTNDNQLTLDYHATTDQTTPIALTNHSYFNLNGSAKQEVTNHYVTFNSNAFLELDEKLIPTGKTIEVDNSTFDFRTGRFLKDGTTTASLQHQVANDGYDHYFLFDGNGHVQITEETSGRTLDVRTTQPGMVMYTSNTLEGGMELAEGQSGSYMGVCFETQGSPASLHHNHISSILLKPDKIYQEKTVFSFGIQA
ncbi:MULTISPECIES: aldose epimerase family protein [Virgibacillus]|uniref:Aldose 1-epimerase n=1 Tax=Virgibacillus massiliensis TaxID=1462526 RepID=A0A024Q8A3_9BACI|nr:MULTISPECIES: aldose epimerase family protein [Virgibacillus]EQB38063.1 hypothetical protein M948_05690 [Virgibacillus sp. CM-4]MYL40780.1 galactose-1-epimerase [Virgibacillus massiliensis]CDQ38425.1 Aldose 1-epimerase precursor [Virgibacillus massiliensis]